MNLVERFNDDERSLRIAKMGRPQPATEAVGIQWAAERISDSLSRLSLRYCDLNNKHPLITIQLVRFQKDY